MTAEALALQPVEAAQRDGFARHLNSQRFLFLTGHALTGQLALSADDIAEFAAFWPRLTIDRHMADGGTYRFRRYGEFDAPVGVSRRLMPHGPYEQPTYINNLNGGVARHFDPLEPRFVTSHTLNRLLNWLTTLYDHCEGQPRHWNIRLHPYRILATRHGRGQPTPEGLHRDGVDYIVSLLVNRRNVAGGETTITDNDGCVLWQRTLQTPMDIMIGKDALTLHGVSPVSRVDLAKDAHRDVLVVAFTRLNP